MTTSIADRIPPRRTPEERALIAAQVMDDALEQLRLSDDQQERDVFALIYRAGSAAFDAEIALVSRGE